VLEEVVVFGRATQLLGAAEAASEGSVGGADLLVRPMLRVAEVQAASAVAEEGGIGTISSIGLGDIEASKNEYEKMSREALQKEIRKAKTMTNGHIAVNFMGVLSNVDDLITTAVKEGIEIIAYGAGLPIKLPFLVKNSSVNLLPIVSSARVVELILRVWDKRYERTADAIILEGPLA